MALGANKTCSADSLPDFQQLHIVGDITVGMVPRDNGTEAAMAACCAPNSVNLVDDCVLWCQLSDELADGSNFAQCLVNNGRKGGGISGVHKAGATMVAGRPSVIGAGLLALAICWLCTAT
ncbi:hypothetical protein F5B20DRAFT_540872 [Whalleya microplaca]|nr:hypothetical protein F5B20DRAFT_540872 [Whalleya microplaca]